MYFHIKWFDFHSYRRLN